MLNAWYICVYFPRMPFHLDLLFLLAKWKLIILKLLGMFVKLFRGMILWVFVTDRELMLMGAIQLWFPLSKNILYIWHIEKNMATNCKRHFSTQETFEDFQYKWRKVVYSTSENEYEEHVKTLQQDHPTTFNYLEETWLPCKQSFFRH